MSQETLLSAAPYEFDHIPTIRELLPKTGGLPGVTYAQVCVINAKTAQDDGWGPVHGTKFYSIHGPNGHAPMVLACKGTPIAGASPSDGARLCLLDNDIESLTGWSVQEPGKTVNEVNGTGPSNESSPPVGAASAGLVSGDESTSLVPDLTPDFTPAGRSRGRGGLITQAEG